MKEEHKTYWIVQLTKHVYLESYMGSSIIGTTAKERVFKFENEEAAREVARKYNGACRTQYDWWDSFTKER